MLARLRSVPVWVQLIMAGGLLGWFQAPYNYWWLSFICVPWFLHLLGSAQGWRAYGRTWLFAYSYFVFGLYWVAHALFVDIAQFWWALPLAAGGLPIILAAFPAVAGWAVQKWGGTGLQRLLLFAVFWALMEWVRGHIFTGYPWLLAGYLWVDVSWARQLAAFSSAYGLTLWAMALAVLPCAWLPGSQISRRKTVFVALLLLVPAIGWGVYWVQRVPAEDAQIVRLRLVQPNIPEHIKLDAQSRDHIYKTLLALSERPGNYQALLWPETALPFRLDERADIRSEIAAILPPEALLMTGVIRRAPDEAGTMHYFNSMLVMNKFGEILGAYDKSHLVPFGEYIPFRNWLPFDPVAGGIDFTKGPGPRTLVFGNLPSVSPLICYEVIFPGQVVQAGHQPRWLLNITNDAWYGLTNGPYQHAEISRLRAVEEGVPIVRVANTGISFVADYHGFINGALPLGTEGVVDVDLPTARLPTPYGRYGNLIFFTQCAVFALLAMLAGIDRRANNSKL